MGCARVSRRFPPCHIISSSPFADASSLDLKAEKENAHNNWITSVGFNKDGDKIVSGSYDKSLKVWDAGRPAHTNRTTHMPPH